MATWGHPPRGSLSKTIAPRLLRDQSIDRLASLVNYCSGSKCWKSASHLWSARHGHMLAFGILNPWH